MKRSCPKKGYTLLEVLIAITILGVISVISFSVIGRYQRNARDARRKSDLKQIQTALEMYRQDCGAYPAGAPAGTSGDPQNCGGRSYRCWKDPIGLLGANDCLDISTPYVCPMGVQQPADFLPRLVELGYLQKEILDPINSPPIECFGNDAEKLSAYIYYTPDYGKTYCLMAILENRNDPQLKTDGECDNAGSIYLAKLPATIFGQPAFSHFDEDHLYSLDSP